MPDLMDYLQDAQAADSEALQARGRLPEALPPPERDCDDCGDAIAAARLKAVPTATHCVGCEELRVQRLRFMGRPRA